MAISDFPSHVLPSPKGQYIKNIFLLFSLSVILTWSYGYLTKNGLGNSLVIFFILLAAQRNTFSSAIAALFILLGALYAPVGIIYGRINDGFIASALQTNSNEFCEFFQLIPVYCFVISGLLIIFTLYFWRQRLRQNNHKLPLLLFIVLAMITWPQHMLSGTVSKIIDTRREMARYQQMAQQPRDTWNVLTAPAKYHTVVVVIGESVRTDYLSAYGYSQPTTPWLNSAASLLINGYISAAATTVNSLMRTLVINNNAKKNINNNIVTLANKAGYYTWWISNQGTVGEHDTPISVIGHSAQRTHFLKTGGAGSQNIDDEQLLPKIAEAIQTPGQKIIFVHMMGSHPNTCNRLFNYPNRFQEGYREKVGCYLASINKLDDMLKNIDGLLRKQPSSFAMIYFSDHGMSVDDSADPVHHSSQFATSYNVPLIITASDITARQQVNTLLSATHFLGIFEWLTGIRTTNLPAVEPRTARDAPSLTIFNGDENIALNTLPLQPLVKRQR